MKQISINISVFVSCGYIFFFIKFYLLIPKRNSYPPSKKKIYLIAYFIFHHHFLELSISYDFTEPDVSLTGNKLFFSLKGSHIYVNRYFCYWWHETKMVWCLPFLKQETWREYFKSFIFYFFLLCYHLVLREFFIIIKIQQF